MKKIKKLIHVFKVLFICIHTVYFKQNDDKKKNMLSSVTKKYMCSIIRSLFQYNIAKLNEDLAKLSTIINYVNLLENSNYCMHALGGINNHSYTNSIEALKQSYAQGYRIYEVDVRLTSDGYPVLVHDWKKNDYIKRIQDNWYLSIEPDAKKNYIPDLKTFMKFKIRKQYTATSFKMLVKFMKEHPDMFVLIDAGYAGYEETYALYEGILRVCRDKSVLNRLITGGHTIGSVVAQQELYPFPIINMYYAKPDIKELEFGSDEEWMKYCKEVGATSYSIAYETYNTFEENPLKESGLYTYVFTVDDEEIANECIDKGVDIVGTNFIRK